MFELGRDLPSVFSSLVGRVGTGLLATILLVVLMVWVRRILARLLERSVARVTRRGHGFSLGSVEIVSGEVVVRLLQTTFSFLRFVVSLTLVYLWLIVVSVAVDRSLELFDLVVHPVRTAAVRVGHSIVGFLPNLAMLAVLAFVAYFAVRTVRVLLDAISARRLTLDWFPPELALPTRRIVTFLIWVLAFIIAFPYLPGSDSKAFQGISVLLGVVVSLGSSSLISNLLGGLVLTYTRAFQPGERIRVGNVLGDVVEMGPFTTRVRTLNDEEVVIPNAVAQSGIVTNYSTFAHERGVQVGASVMIGYGVPWRRVHALLEEAARLTPGVKSSPAPYVLQKALDNFFVRYELFVSTDRPQEMHILEARLLEHIQDAFAEAGVDICTPRYEVHRRSSEPSAVGRHDERDQIGS